MELAALLLRRLILAVPVLFAMLLFTFLLVRVGGNDPVALLVGPAASAQEIAAVTAKLKLDQPVWRQFAEYIALVLRGDLGVSFLSERPVTQELLTRLPATLEIVLIGAGLGALVGVPAGLRAAARPGGLFDHASRVFSLIGFGMPTIFLGLLLVFVFFYLLRWAPPPMGRLDLMMNPPTPRTGSVLIDALISADGSAALSAAGRLVLPCFAVAVVFAAPLLKQVRAIAVDVLASDHIRHARACGLPPGAIRAIVRRNAAAPVITYAASELIAMFGAASVLELIFAWGGVSQFGLNAILKGDYAVVQGYVLLMCLIAFVIFAAADALVLILEPRARQERA